MEHCYSPQPINHNIFSRQQLKLMAPNIHKVNY